MFVSLEPVTAEHVAWVGQNMRECDRREIWVSHRALPEASVREGVAMSRWAHTGLVDDVPVCIFGVAPGTILTGDGRPWMLATDGLERASRPMIRLARPVVELMLGMFPLLKNHVDARNTRTLPWLRSLGFTIEDPVPFGPDGLPFHCFWRTR